MDTSSPSIVQDLPDDDAFNPSGRLSDIIFALPTKALAIKVLECVFVGLMLIAMTIRLYVRAAITKRWRGDDCEFFFIFYFLFFLKPSGEMRKHSLTCSSSLYFRRSMAFGNFIRGNKLHMLIETPVRFNHTYDYDHPR